MDLGPTLIWQVAPPELSIASWHAFAQRVHLSVTAVDPNLAGAPTRAREAAGANTGGWDVAASRASVLRHGYMKHESWLPTATAGGFGLRVTGYGLGQG